ncbi:hypothetical protein [Streptomyces sp. NPDC053069]|uniref:hypothetical protein n=1 Tax=Streptomyces sp. NPDC053069 TaxID=3365695 RepID=UPI0037D49F4B
MTRRRDIEASGVAVTYCVFGLLRRALSFRAPLRLTPHRNAGGAELLDRACARGWRG